MSRNLEQTPSCRRFPAHRFVKTAFHNNIGPQHRCLVSQRSATSMFRPASLRSIDVWPRIAPQHRCFVTHRSAASMFCYASVRRIDVSSRIGPQHRCFVTHRSAASMFCYASLRSIDVLLRIAPQHRCFVTHRSAASMFCPASVHRTAAEKNRFGLHIRRRIRIAARAPNNAFNRLHV